MNSPNQNYTEPQTIPESFFEDHYCQHHVMYILQIDEIDFWQMYVTGRIPRGYSLMALTGAPLVVWPKDVLDQWNIEGRQPDPGAIEIENRVLHSLIHAFEKEGIQFPAYPPPEPFQGN